LAQKTALVVGSTGIVGLNLATHLAQQDWAVYGLARRAASSPGIHAVAADLLDPASLSAALHDIKPTHVYITTWMRQPTEAENIRVNSAMVRNLLVAVEKSNSVEHVGLVTGLKHYLGPGLQRRQR
jgi:nucleoside-diphosphate-sugar epimerase